MRKKPEDKTWQVPVEGRHQAGTCRGKTPVRYLSREDTKQIPVEGRHVAGTCRGKSPSRYLSREVT